MIDISFAGIISKFRYLSGRGHLFIRYEYMAVSKKTTRVYLGHVEKSRTKEKNIRYHV
jgi:hypothetical protein